MGKGGARERTFHLTRNWGAVMLLLFPLTFYLCIYLFCKFLLVQRITTNKENTGPSRLWVQNFRKMEGIKACDGVGSTCTEQQCTHCKL